MSTHRDAAIDYPNLMHYTNRLQAINKLGKVYVRFSALNTAESKFTFTRDLFKKHKMLPKAVHKLESYMNEIYDHPLSDTIRSRGNVNFKNKKYAIAIDNYSESLILSVPGSQNYALALANRSAALYHTEEYQYCLDDIRRALQSQYPTALLYKLYERAGNAERMLGHGDLAKRNYLKCLKYMEKSTMSENEKSIWKKKVTDAIESCHGLEMTKVFKKKTPVNYLLGGKNEKIPALSKHLELKLAKGIGRGIFATSDINPGDVVAIDNTYIGGASPDYTNICHYAGCLKMSISIIPCPKCSLAYYCNEECIQKAIQDGHNLECSILYSIRTIPGVQKMNELVLRWFLREYTKMGIDNYCSVVNNLKITKMNPLTRGFDENDQFKSDNFLAAYSMKCCEDNLPMDILFFFNCIAVEILQYLILSGFKISEKYIPTVGASLVHMFNLIDFNCRTLYLNNPSVAFEMDKEFTIPVAFGLYPSISLFNHSCDPNIKRSGVLSEQLRVLKAIQPIPKGSQVFVSYGIFCDMNCRNSRRKYLMKHFKFKCSCKPCYENWPSTHYITTRLSSFNLLNEEMANTVSLECKRFMKFKETTEADDYHKHLNYLYRFNKIISANVKRPFRLYEDCLSMISSAHISLSNTESKFFAQVFDEIHGEI